MGAWSLLLAAGICLVFLGLFTHWSISLAGALLPFAPVITELVRRRRGLHPRPGEPGQSGQGEDTEMPPR